MATRDRRGSLLRFAVAAPLIAAGLSLGAAVPAGADTTQTFDYTGEPQTFTVPATVTSLQVVAEGGDGGPSSNGEYFVDGVKGATVSTLLAVTPGDELEIRVAGAGAWPAGGYNGGGSAPEGGAASGGGGASDVRMGGSALADRVVVAGGGGGGRSSDSPGGVGGTPDGQDGSDVSADEQGDCVVNGGGGATTTAPGDGGVLVEQFTDACNPTLGFTAGSAGDLGDGADSNATYAAGGGGGYYGGGSGGGDELTGTGAGGGGGSSYVPGDPDAENTTYSVKSEGSQAAGKVTITYTLPTVTFDSNGGSGSMAAQEAAVPTALSANAFTHTGYTFTGWNTVADGSGTAYEPGGEYPFDADATLYAQWSINNYVLSYDSNGAHSGTPPDYQIGDFGSDVTVAGNTGGLERTGYSFTGWNTQPDGSGTSYAPGDALTLPTDTTLYAQWRLNQYTLSYDGNGADSGTPPDYQIGDFGSDLTVAGNTGGLARTGYTFTGWNTQPDGSGTHYAPGDALTVATDTTLYAQWSINQYTLNYDGNGADSGTPPNAQDGDFGSDLTVAGNTGGLARTGYTFGGWNTQANGSGTAYEPGDPLTLTDDVTLYAQWSINQYSVSYNDNDADGGAIPTGQVGDFGSDVTVAGNTGGLARTGYTFGGWNTQANGSGTAYEPGDPLTLTDDVTLYAQWQADPAPTPEPTPTITPTPDPTPTTTAEPTPTSDPTASPAPTAPGQVTGLKAKVKSKATTSKRTVVLRWRAASSAESYSWRHTNKKGTKYLAWKSATATKAVKKFGVGKYRVQVRAVNDAGAGQAAVTKFRVR